VAFLRNIMLPFFLDVLGENVDPLHCFLKTESKVLLQWTLLGYYASKDLPRASWISWGKCHRTMDGTMISGKTMATMAMVGESPDNSKTF